MTATLCLLRHTCVQRQCHFTLWNHFQYVHLSSSVHQCALVCVCVVLWRVRFSHRWHRSTNAAMCLLDVYRSVPLLQCSVSLCLHINWFSRCIFISACSVAHDATLSDYLMQQVQVCCGIRIFCLAQTRQNSGPLDVSVAYIRHILIATEIDLFLQNRKHCYFSFCG